MTHEFQFAQREGVFSVMLRSCTCGILSHILDRAVPFVWIRRHMPQRSLQWWRTELPLAPTGRLYGVEVRSLEFDLQLPTESFLELLPEFEEHGILLFQMSRRVPDTLTLDRIAEEAINRVLLQNGMHLKFYLPHAMECAQLSSPRSDVLATILQRPEIGALAYH